MTTLSSRALRNASTLAAALFAALSVQAADLGQDNYRRVVLGDTSVAAPVAASANEQVVPGSYARYLIVNGMDTTQALATARATGEMPTLQAAPRLASSGLSGQQRYERVMGIDG